MQEPNYNGWTNYATWRVNLEIFDGFDANEYFGGVDEYYLHQALREHAEEIVLMGVPAGLAYDYASSFLGDVNWHEIAEHLIENMETNDD